MSAKDALLKFYKRDADKLSGKSQRKRRKNASPEKDLEKEILRWSTSKGIDLHVIEAKAVYSVSAGRYLRGQAEAGLPDLVGNCEGLSVWIELKAPGRRSTLKVHQRDFLVRKISQGCFAVCVDSVESLAKVLASFLSTPASDRVQLLLDHLPKQRPQRPSSPDEELF